MTTSVPTISTIAIGSVMSQFWINPVITYETNETAVLLVAGEVKFTFGDRTETGKRENPFVIIPIG